MSFVSDFWRSSVGGKVIMAITGVLLFLFVVAHLLGNLQILAGPQAINDYAKFLHSKPALLWVARIGLLAIFVLHVVTAIRLSGENRRARPVAYARQSTLQATFASRSMVLSGLSLLGFIVYHLMHFTLGVVHGADVARKGVDGHNVHDMVVASFSNGGVVAAYVAFQVVLFLHLSHGLQSFAQTLGLNHARWTPIVKTASFVLAAAVTGGNVLLALAPTLGLVKLAS